MYARIKYGCKMCTDPSECRVTDQRMLLLTDYRYFKLYLFLKCVISQLQKRLELVETQKTSMVMAAMSNEFSRRMAEIFLSSWSFWQRPRIMCFRIPCMYVAGACRVPQMFSTTYAQRRLDCGSPLKSISNITDNGSGLLYLWRNAARMQRWRISRFC